MVFDGSKNRCESESEESRKFFLSLLPTIERR